MYIFFFIKIVDIRILMFYHNFKNGMLELLTSICLIVVFVRGPHGRLVSTK